MSGHTCHALNCEVAVPRKIFMCRRHWFMLPKEMRDAVWATYTPGQQNHLDRVSREYLDVAMAAVDWIAERERVGS